MSGMVGLHEKEWWVPMVRNLHLRQLHQTDQAYTRRLLEDKPFPATEVTEFSKMVTYTMSEAVMQLSRLRQPLSKQGDSAKDHSQVKLP